MAVISTSKEHLKYQLKSLEKLPIRIWEDSTEASAHVAKSIALAIRQKQQEGERIVLGLATGSSPIGVYKELVRMHKEDNLSFSNVITFNLDEYYPMSPTSQQSYVRFMHDYLFDHIDINPKNIHIPDGTIPMEEVEDYCEQYEKMIDLVGGIDIQLLGIGRTGHIGFNEPGSWKDSKTRLVRLDNMTRRDAVKDFAKADAVPYRAITMGVGSIMKARSIYMLVWGQHKATILQKAAEGSINSTVSASFLQEHPNVKVIVDKAASTELTRIKTPWLIGMCNWDDDLICQAVVWLSQKVGKPMLKLTDNDYNENHLSELIIEYASSYELNIKVHNRLQDTITGWPGGKPNVDDARRPERAAPSRKRVIIFSPHPDDDVISMGGTFLRLVEQGHDVHVAYQTSGNIAVHDYDALRFIEFMQEFNTNIDIFKEANNGRSYIATGAGAVNNMPDGVTSEVLSCATEMGDFHWYFESNEKKIRSMGGDANTQNVAMTATEANITASKQNALLNTIADNAEQGFARIVAYCAMFEGLYQSDNIEQSLDDVIVELPRDFATPKLTETEVQEYRQDYLNGLISQSQYIEIMIKGGWRDREVETILNHLVSYKHDYRGGQ